MKHTSRTVKIIGLVLGLFIISGTAIVGAQILNQPSQSQKAPPVLPTPRITPAPTRPAYCVPLPQEVEPGGSRTPTPDRFSTPNSGMSPTVTPRVYANVFDFSPALSLEDKSQVTVYRCDGTFDLFIAGPEIDIIALLDLGPGDVVFGSLPPASLVGHEPPEPPDWPTTSPATAIPYPAPNTKTPIVISSTPISYPATFTLTPVITEP